MGDSPAPPPARPHRLYPLILAGLLALAFSLLLAAVGALWLATSEKGLALTCSLAQTWSGGRLRLTPREGSLAGPLRLQEVVWEDKGLTLRMSEVALDWSPGTLPRRLLHIHRLSAARVRIDLSPSPEPPKLPASLALPLAVEIGELAVGRLEKGDRLLAEDLSGRVESDGHSHVFTGLSARASQVALRGEGRLQGDAPFTLAARATVWAQLENQPFTLDLQAGGRLDRIELAGQAAGSLQGRLAALATPFAGQPFERLQLHLSGLNPADWVQGAPAAQLDIDTDVLPRLGEEWTVGGQFTVANRKPGRLDAHRLPVTRLAGRVDWQGGAAHFSSLDAALLGSGRLRGRGQLAGQELSLDLQASRLDAAALHPRLRPTRLAGPLKLHLGAGEQTLAADLADPQFRLAARASRQGDRVEIPELKLEAGAARLEAGGILDLKDNYRFEARGRLVRFDPARFARLPAARINASLQAAGSLRPRPVLALAFDLGDSSFKGRPLAGRGHVDLDWPEVRRIEARLTAGPNRLEAHGAFGRPGDRLTLAIDAPALAPYGIDGDLQGDLLLTGTQARPAVNGRLRSNRLGLPDRGRVQGLSLQGEVGTRADDPLRIDLRLASLALPGRADAARDVSLQVTGSRASHSLQAGAALAGQRRLELAGAGGLAEKAGKPFWRGRLDRFTLTAPDPAQGLALVQPAKLQVGAGEWDLGPAELANPEWRGHFLASAGQGRLRIEATGRGQRLGEIDARLEARLAGPWQLAATAPWQGRLTLAAADVAWLGPWIGENWRTAGRLQGEMRLSGTPDRPLLTGQVRGSGLGLRIPDQGLELDNGRLAADFADDLVRVTALDFDSRLYPPPRRLLRSAADSAALAASPGKLTVRGEMRLGMAGRAAAGEGGYLDLSLDRVGLYQQSDRWVAVSGSGRLSWQGLSLTAEGKLRADAGYWELARADMPRLSDDVVVHRAEDGSGGGKSPAKLDLDITADLGPRFYFVGAGLESRLAGSLRLRAAGRDLPRATGTIHTVQGKFDAYGQKLAVERGIINFQGFLDSPGLNVRAVRRDLPVEAGVEVTGSVKKPVVRLVSDPELPEAEKLSWLVLGHGSEQTGSGDASTLVNAATTLLGRDNSGGVLQQLQRRFGVEALGLRQGQIGDSGGRQATSRVAPGSGFSGAGPNTASQIVTVSKRLSANTLLTYEQTLGRTENIVKLTVNLSRRLSVVGRAGSDNALDLFYTFSFGK